MSIRQQRYELTVNTPTFVVNGCFIGCVVCQNPSVGLNVYTHVNGQPHQHNLVRHSQRLTSMPAPPNALNLDQAAVVAEEMQRTKQERRAAKRKRPRDADAEATSS